MTFLNPLALLFALFAIPIILLYMLRLRRREVLVSSHFLWQRLLLDQTANTPWQRLRRNLLLLLQLVILAFLVLALARPAIAVTREVAGRTVILLDASASMNTLNQDGRSRWQHAQDRAQELVRQLGVGDTVSVIRVGDTAESLTEYTNNSTELQNAIQTASVGQGVADWNTAFTLAVGGASTSETFSIVIISDGSNGAISQEVLPANVPQPRFISVGDSVANLAITALAVRNVVGANPQLFAQVQHYGTSDSTFSLTIRLDGVLWSSQEATIGANAQRNFVFEIDQAFTTVQANLVYPVTTSDFLALDNTAWAVYNDQQTRRVLVISQSDNRFLGQVLASLPTVQFFNGDPTRPELPQEAYDLYVFEGYLPNTLPLADMLIVNPPRSTGLFTVGNASQETNNITTLVPSHPLMQYVDFSAVNVRQVQPLQSNLLEPLVAVQGGGLLWAGTNNNQQVAVLPFALSDSDLPLQIAFPILMSNMVDWFTPPNRLTDSNTYVPNTAVTLVLPALANQVRVTTPSEQTVLLERGEVFLDTGQLGLYRAQAYQDEQALLSQSFAVNLFNSTESQIAPLSELTFSGGASRVRPQGDESLLELWGIFALLAFAVLLLEWWVYHRQFRLA
jgi:hypothetical protein